MTFLAELWLPILVSAVLVFIASALANTVLPHHKTELRAAPNQDALQSALRGAAPGRYLFPSPPDPRDRGKPEWLQKVAAGPSGFVTLVPPGPFSMGRNLALSFALNLLISFFTAYVAWHGFASGGAAPHYRTVFRFVGALGFMTYALAGGFDSIWYGKPWRAWLNNAIDGLLYGLVMAGAFGWLWPR
jgi:hypothetical protein